MTSFKKSISYGNYGFRFTENAIEHSFQISGVGYELRQSTDYYFDGLTRQDKNRYLFQYTLSGCGAFSYKGDTHKVTEGTAFLAKIPSEHIYYLPNESNGWEFIYIMLSGTDIEKYWTDITDKLGLVVKINNNSSIIKILQDIILQAAQRRINDSYQSASLAFQFLMELCRFAHTTPENEYPILIQKAIGYIEANFSKIESIDTIAQELNVSKFYLIRQFSQHLNTTPGRYLKKIRMEQASHLLHHTDDSLEKIAADVGLTTANYLSKVFKMYLGTTPSEFRAQRSILPYTHIKL